MASNNDAKPLYLYDIDFSLIFITKCGSHQGLNKQLINLRYNDVKNLTSSLYHCIGPKCVPSANALSPCDNHFYFITLADNYLRTNK